MKQFLLFTGLICGISGWTQKASFSVDQINGEVLLTVTIFSGNFCNGIDFQRSADSINFETIGSIQGYCGNISEAVTYSWTDEDPIVNQKSYYRARLVGLSDTEIRSILVLDFEGENFRLTTNPITEVSSLFFNNPPNKEVTFTMYNLNGQVAYEKTGIGNYFDITANEHENGVYLFSVKDTDGKELASGKLMISNQ